MDPATITALSIGITSLVSIIAAGVVACCRKQKNVADKRNQGESNDSLKITMDAYKTTTTVTENADGDKVTTTVAETPKIAFEVNIIDSRTDTTNASNHQNGYAKNTVPVLRSSNNTTSNTEGAASSTTTNPATSSSTSSDNEASSSSNIIDPSLFNSNGSQGSVYHIKKVAIMAMAGGATIIINDLSSSDTNGSQGLPQSKDVELIGGNAAETYTSSV